MWKKIGSFLLLAAGVVAVGIAVFIGKQLDAGREQIGQAKEMVEQGNKLFSLTPATKEASKHLSKSVDKKIRAGEAQIGYYEQIKFYFTVGGLFLIVLGALTLFFGKKNHSK